MATKTRSVHKLCLYGAIFHLLLICNAFNEPDDLDVDLHKIIDHFDHDHNQLLSKPEFEELYSALEKFYVTNFGDFNAELVGEDDHALLDPIGLWKTLDSNLDESISESELHEWVDTEEEKNPLLKFGLLQFGLDLNEMHNDEL